MSYNEYNLYGHTPKNHHYGFFFMLILAIVIDIFMFGSLYKLVLKIIGALNNVY